MSEYIIKLHSEQADASFKVKYKKGRFFSLQHVKGKLNQQQHEKLMLLAPQLESAILILQQNFNGRVSWEKVVKESKSLYAEFLDKYTTWYEELFQLKPKMSGIEGNALKQIISYLQGVSETDQEAKDIWDVILSNWKLLTDFYQNQTELRQINSNLNIILKTLKHGELSDQSRRSATTSSDDFRENISN